jgi:HEAT repeat protein
MAVSEALKAAVARMPDPDKRGMYCENIDNEKIEAAVAEIHKGGRENVLGLIGMLGEPGAADNVKPHYALHGLVNHVLIIKDEKGRKALCETIAEQLGNAELSDSNRSYLCQELQWAGRGESTPALGKLLLNANLTEPASMALVAIGGEAAMQQFRSALPKAEGKCRLNVVRSLATLGDAQSAEGLRAALTDPDREVRIAAGAGLAAIGDAAAVDALIKAADVEPGWERIQATKNCLVLAERLTAAGKQADARKIYEHLSKTRTDPSERYIQTIALSAL